MLHRRLFWSVAASICALSSTLPASAHVGHGDVDGFTHGLMHPIGGLDHFLAMTAVGMLAALLGRRAIWIVPLSFMLTMVVGAALAIGQVELPFVELAIAMSVVVLGLAVALQVPLPTIAAVGLVGFFALFHGYAHGAEMPMNVSGASYAAGFLAATALLHLAGIAIGFAFKRAQDMRDVIPRIAGCAIAVAGVFLVAGI